MTEVLIKKGNLYTETGMHRGKQHEETEKPSISRRES